MEWSGRFEFADLRRIYRLRGARGAAEAWQEAAQRAVLDGHLNIWGAGSPSLDCCGGHEGLMTFEHGMDAGLRGLPVVAMCTYDAELSVVGHVGRFVDVMAALIIEGLGAPGVASGGRLTESKISDLATSGIAELSLRHAAVAAGLGAFGRHNLVVHPRFGTRVIFAAVLTDLELPSDPPVEANPCTDCGLCVEACPSGALDEPGKTHLGKCLGTSQPYGVRGSIAFWSRFAEAGADDRKAMLRSPEYLSLYQAGFVGFQCFCFRCLAVCPVGRG